MLSFLFEVPPGSGRGPLVVVLVLEMENVERMKQADPFDLGLRGLSPPARYKASDVDLVIAYEDDRSRLRKFQQDQDIAGFIRWLERGRRIRSVNDVGPPRPINLSKKEPSQ